MKKQNKDNYFKGLRKSPKQLLDSLKKYLTEVTVNIQGYADTCEYHLEQEHCKNSDDFAGVQDISQELINHLEYVVDILEEDGPQADLSPYKLYCDEEWEEYEL